MSGVIYKIVTGNEVYVGSTIDYKHRAIKHKSSIYNKNSSCYELKLYKAIRANDGDWEMSIYEENLSMTKDELRIREEEVRLLLGATLNSMRAYRTIEQKKECQNKSEVAYRNKNREACNKRTAICQKQIVKCECGLMITRGSMARHLRRSKHLKLMTSPELA